MDWDVVGPSPSQFSSSSQWARASTRPSSANTSIDDDVGYVTWKHSQPDPLIRELMHSAESKKEGKRDQKLRLDASAHTSTWASSTSTSIPYRTASLPVLSTPSTSVLPSTFASNSSRKLHPMKLISKKVPPSRAYSATAPVKDGVSSDPKLAAGYLHIIRNGTAEMDENSRRKQAAKAKAEKEAASGTLRNIATQRNTHASSSGSKSTFAARPLKKTASIPAASSAPPRGSVLSRSLSSATIKPTVKLSRDSGTCGDIQMTLDSDRDTDPEGSIFTDSVCDLAPDESFSMHVDDVLPPPKRAVGRTPSIVMDTSPTASTSNSGFMLCSKALTAASTSASIPVPEKIPQSRHVHPVVAPSTTQRGPPPLGMRRQHNLPNPGFPSSQSRYATIQSPYAASQAKGQKPVTIPPFKPPLLKKPNSKAVPAPKQVVQTPESPPTSTPELVKDDGNDDDGGGEEDTLGVADSSFDVSFDVDADALEATMRQYD
ncbi:uncharacterized protein EDB93DRAFT_1163627 [Suillus bovinus]|uniref:uncharacterized protein n=1 Tax=Suillus bovinus TaxID=48563 RepID=UPI001B87FE22|nr:uncharacterized protein EDB93DRAFT_1163627 [Suillus bovinus]KAG2139164.1 hypothetical protein EDB93DRAFT_1163627 [Suillus bovinus]